MRQRIEQNKKADGPLGIRTRVWLIVFGLVLVCLLTIELSRHHTSRLTRETASEDVADQDSSTRPQASVRRTAHKEFTPEVYESGAGYDNGESQLSMIEQMIQDRRTYGQPTLTHDMIMPPNCALSESFHTKSPIKSSRASANPL